MKKEPSPTFNCRWDIIFATIVTTVEGRKYNLNVLAIAVADSIMVSKNTK
jgi:hypothetical protein